MAESRYIARAREIAARMIGGEMMIMSGRDSTLFSLNETASVLWQAADGVTPLDEIVEKRICTAYDVDPAVALRDAEELAEALAHHGILHLADAPIPEPSALPGPAP